MDQEQRLWLWLDYAAGHDAPLFYELLRRLDDLEEAFESALSGDFEAFGELDGPVKKRLEDASSEHFLGRYEGWMERNGIGISTPDSDNYPSLLAATLDPPPVLFYAGTLPPDPPLPVYLCGPDPANVYGNEAAALLARGIAENGGTVVTALDPDAEPSASLAALETFGSSCPLLAVLPCGIERIFEPDKRELYRKITEKGCVLTEFLPKTQITASHYRMRERLLCGLSRAAVIIDCGKNAETEAAAECMKELRRSLFAVPGRITDKTSLYPNLLIRQGEAVPVLGPEDILAEFSDYCGFSASDRNPNAKRIGFSALSDTAQQVYMALLQGAFSLTELQGWVDEPEERILPALGELESLGIARQTRNGRYELDRGRSVVTFEH